MRTFVRNSPVLTLGQNVASNFEAYGCSKPDVAAAKAFFRRAFTAEDRPRNKITLDGFQASHRAAQEPLNIPH
jgi:hypothetical protein